MPFLGLPFWGKSGASDPLQERRTPARAENSRLGCALLSSAGQTKKTRVSEHLGFPKEFIWADLEPGGLCT